MIVFYMTHKELIEWREKNNYSQSALSVALGVTRGCMSRWESGKRHIPPFLYLALKYLEVKKGDELLMDKATKTKKGKERKHGKRHL
jgi:transcriptional regulator with XRE-family HTH domain